MNWRGNLIAAAMWLALLAGITSLTYNTIYDYIENYNVAIQLIAEVDNASRGKISIIDVRIENKQLKLFYETDVTSSSAGLTEIQSDDVKEIINGHLEWAMIHRDVVTIQFNWSREDRSGQLYQYFQIVCLAQHVVEEAPNPNCDTAQRWYPLPKKNQRFR